MGANYSGPNCIGNMAITVADEGVLVGQFTIFNFIGAGVEATDAGGGQVDITIAGGVASPYIASSGSGSAILVGSSDFVSTPFSTSHGLDNNISGLGDPSIAAGFGNTITGSGCAVFNAGNVASGLYDFIAGAGNSTDSSIRNNTIFGSGNLITNSRNAFCAGVDNTIQKSYSTAFGNSNLITGQSSFCAGINNVLSGNVSTALGSSGITSGVNAITLGLTTRATGAQSFAGGQNTIASGTNSFNFSHTAELSSSVASGTNSALLGGTDNKVSGNNSAIIGGSNLTLAEPDTLMAQNFRIERDFRISQGGDNAVGSETLVAGTVTVGNSSIKPLSKIMLTRRLNGGTLGFIYSDPASIIDGVSFIISSSDILDTSTIDYLIINP